MPSRVEVERALEERLSAPRAAHARRVALEAVALAQRFGVAREPALWAGLFHDWYKEVPGAQLLDLARSTGVVPPGTPDAAVVIGTLHGPVAARLLPARWPELGAEVWAAVDRHTTGDVEMSALDCVLYCADLVEPERRFAGVQELRALVRRDLHAATLAGMTATLRALLDGGRRIDPRAVIARNAMLARLPADGAAPRYPR